MGVPDRQGKKDPRSKKDPRRQTLSQNMQLLPTFRLEKIRFMIN